MPTVVIQQPTIDHRSGTFENPNKTNGYGNFIDGYRDTFIRYLNGYIDNFGTPKFVTWGFWVVFEIPLGTVEELTSAIIRFTSEDAFYLEQTPTWDFVVGIKAHKVTNSDPPANWDDCMYQSDPANSTNTIDWYGPFTWGLNGEGNALIYTPNLAPIVNEIRSLPGWATNNKIVFYFRQSSPLSIGAGQYNYVSYQYYNHLSEPPHSTTHKPIMELVWTEPPPNPEPDDSHYVEHTLEILDSVNKYMTSGRFEHTLLVEQDIYISKSRTRGLEQTISFQQEINDVGTLEVSVTHDLFIIEVLEREYIPVRSVEHTIKFEAEIIRNGRLDKQILQIITFQEDVAAGKVYNRELEQTLDFESDPNTTTKQKSFTHYLDIQQSFSYDGTFQRPHKVEDTLTFTQDIVAGGNRTRGVEHTLTFTPAILAYGNFTDCDPKLEWVNAPTIIKSRTITLTHGATTLELPSPLFNDREELFMERVSRKTRGGDLKVFRDSEWLKIRTFRYKFERLDEDKALETFQFMSLTLGLKITLVDHEGFTWEGYITNPQAESAQYVRNCGYTTEFEFEGVQV